MSDDLTVPSPDDCYEGPHASRYDRGRELTPHAEGVWRRAVEPYLTDARVVLDVGAGTGRFSRRLAVHFAASVIAVEPASAMRAVAAASPLGAHERWLAGRAEALPVRDGTVDVVWLAFVAHHLDLERTGAELARVLAPAGRVLVWSVFPDRFDDVEWMRWFPAARAIDAARMPSVEHVRQAWAGAGLALLGRELHPVEVAPHLADLAGRIEQRAISTLELISDLEFERGLDALRQAASSGCAAPVTSPHELVVFGRVP